LSLISSWRSPAVGRAFYDTCQSHELDVKLRVPNVGPRLLPYLDVPDNQHLIIKFYCTSTYVHDSLLIN
jgi:hypothetical protein